MLNSHKTPFPPLSAPFTASTPLREVARDWVADLERLLAGDPDRRLRSPATLVSRRYGATMIEPSPGVRGIADLPIGEITPRRVLAHLREIAVTRGASAAWTQGKHLRQMWRHAQLDGLRLGDPLAGVLQPCPRGRPARMDRDLFAAVGAGAADLHRERLALAAAAGLDAAETARRAASPGVLVLLSTSGARVGEICPARAEDLDDAAGGDLVLWARIVKGGGARRAIPLVGDGARVARLHAALVGSGPLFPAGGALGHVRDVQVGRCLRAVQRQIGHPEPLHGPHALRRAFAEHAIRDGVDPADVACALGHRDLGTTLRYAGAALTPGAFDAARRLAAKGGA